MTLEPILGPRVTVERIRALFGNAGPVVGEIWEVQFDAADDELRQLARTPWKQLFDQSFWVYFHDLNYVELQPALFDYLFPACLTMAQERLMSGHEGLCSGDSDFIRSLGSRNWTTVCIPEQVDGTYEILIDGFFDRLDRQEGFHELNVEFDANDWVTRYNWIGRFVSLGYILPSIEPLWQRWWDIGSPGQAIDTLEFASNLVIRDEDDWGEELPLESGAFFASDSLSWDRGWEVASVEIFSSSAEL